jgi:hypothetical protein
MIIGLELIYGDPLTRPSRDSKSPEVGSSSTTRAQKVVDRRFKNLWLRLRKARFAENLYIILVSTVSQQMVVLHHLLLNGLPEPPHRRGFPPVAWWLITLRISETRDHKLNISLRFISISISHSVKRSQKPMNMSTTNNYEDRNTPTCLDLLSSSLSSVTSTLPSPCKPIPIHNTLDKLSPCIVRGPRYIYFYYNSHHGYICDELYSLLHITK